MCAAIQGLRARARTRAGRARAWNDLCTPTPVNEQETSDLSQTRFEKLRRDIRDAIERAEGTADRTRELLLAAELLRVKYTPRPAQPPVVEAPALEPPARTTPR